MQLIVKADGRGRIAIDAEVELTADELHLLTKRTVRLANSLTPRREEHPPFGLQPPDTERSGGEGAELTVRRDWR